MPCYSTLQRPEVDCKPLLCWNTAPGDPKPSVGKESKKQCKIKDDSLLEDGKGGKER